MHSIYNIVSVLLIPGVCKCLARETIDLRSAHSIILVFYLW